MESMEDILMKLKYKARPDQVKGMAKFGIISEKRLGVSIPDLRKLAKEVKINHQLAVKLWKADIPEAKILASMIADADKMTNKQMEDWVDDINSWDICDQVCLNVFRKTSLAWEKIKDWSNSKEEFVKRTAFSLTACLAVHEKKIEDNKFLKLFPLIKIAAVDKRNFVKKSVSWALRSIGKRNLNMNSAAIELAREIEKIDSPAARWIAADAIRELESDKIQKRLRNNQTILDNFNK